MKWLKEAKINNVYHITLNRPQVRNAFNPEMIQELTQVFSQPPADARVVVLRGEGKVFCSGADLDWMKSMVNFTFEQNQTDSLQLYGMFSAMRRCSLPVITVVQGAAMGGALGLMACSDVVLAEANSQFCFSEVKLGLAPAVISRFILARTTLAATSPWMISGKLFGIAEAVQMGLVHETGTTLELEKHLAEWLKSFMEAAPSAVSDTKKLLMDLPLLPESEQRTLTTDLIAARRISVEGQEGLRAFLEKRQASWKEESQ